MNSEQEPGDDWSDNPNTVTSSLAGLSSLAVAVKKWVILPRLCIELLAACTVRIGAYDVGEWPSLHLKFVVGRLIGNYAYARDHGISAKLKKVKWQWW